MSRTHHPGMNEEEEWVGSDEDRTPVICASTGKVLAFTTDTHLLLWCNHKACKRWHARPLSSFLPERKEEEGNMKPL